MDVLIKICGMREADNIRDVLMLNPDFMGLIFYSKSPRYVESNETLKDIHFGKKIKKTGVFVNATEDEIMQKVTSYDLQAVQLHGTESVLLCQSLKNRGLTVIKAFQIHDAEDFGMTSMYGESVDYFLFDTKTKSYGGSGAKFDWDLLNSYCGDIPFFLSGGIGPDDAGVIREINHPYFKGIDLNSKFETVPAIKDYRLLQQFINQLKSYE
jgi:phosphoribosylanthranilate isomerase